VEPGAVGRRLRRSSTVIIAAVALAAVSPAHANPGISPPVVTAGVSQVFTLAVEPEKEDVVATMVELYVPSDFKIESFAEAEGWEQDWTIQSGTAGVVQKATWTRAEVPKDDEEIEEAVEHAALFQFVGHPQASKTYAFEVRQTYSDGSAIHWTSGRSQAFPPDPRNTSKRSDVPTLTAQASLDGGEGVSTLSLAALAVGALGLAAGLTALLWVIRPRAVRS
jgi:uncharacterized protein YcnI